MASSSHRYVPFQLGRDLNDNRNGRWLWLLLKQIVRFPGVLHGERIDLVHLNFPFDTKGVLRDSFFCWLASVMGVPVFLHVHGGANLMDGAKSPFLDWVAGSTFRRSAAVAVLSELEAGVVRARFPGVDIAVLPNAVDIPAPEMVWDRRKSAVPTVLFLGRLHESKGVTDLAEAIAEVFPRAPFRLVVCGNGPLEAEFTARCRLIMGDNFEFRGVVSGTEKAQALSEASVFVLPSRYGEGLPMALLEAMAYGIAPITTDDASMAQVVAPEVNGLRVRKADPAHLAEQLLRLVTDEGLRGRLGAAARESVARRHDAASYVSQLEHLYSTKCLGRAVALDSDVPKAPP